MNKENHMIRKGQRKDEKRKFLYICIKYVIGIYKKISFITYTN